MAIFNFTGLEARDDFTDDIKLEGDDLCSEIPSSLQKRVFYERNSIEIAVSMCSHCYLNRYTKVVELHCHYQSL